MEHRSARRAPRAHPSRARRVALRILALVATGLLVAAVWYVTGRVDRDDDSAGRAPSSEAESTTAPAASAGSSSTAADDLSAEVAATPEAASDYLAVELATLSPESMPAGVTFVGAALVVADPSFSVAQVADETGAMFWLARSRTTADDGSLVDWEVVDAVRWPFEPGRDDVVVLGDVLCRAGTAAEQGPVAAVFAPTGGNVVDGALAAWSVELGAERLSPVDGEVSCPNPNAGF